MTQKNIPLHCPTCSKPWVDTETGKWSICDDCPHRMPPEASKETPSRKKAKCQLACGDFCRGKNGFIHDLGAISVCGICPNEDLIREGVESQYKGGGQKKPVEVVFPPKRKPDPLMEAFWKHLSLVSPQERNHIIENILRKLG